MYVRCSFIILNDLKCLLTCSHQAVTIPRFSTSRLWANLCLLCLNCAEHITKSDIAVNIMRRNFALKRNAKNTADKNTLDRNPRQHEATTETVHILNFIMGIQKVGKSWGTPHNPAAAGLKLCTSISRSTRVEMFSSKLREDTK